MFRMLYVLEGWGVGVLLGVTLDVLECRASGSFGCRASGSFECRASGVGRRASGGVTYVTTVSY